MFFLYNQSKKRIDCTKVCPPKITTVIPIYGLNEAWVKRKIDDAIDAKQKIDD